MNLEQIDKLNETIMVLSGLKDTTLSLIEGLSSEITDNQLVLLNKVLESCVNNLQEIKQEVENEV